MDFRAAQRRLELIDDAPDLDSPLQGECELPMTQIPTESSANVLISTQVQGRLDDEELKSGLRKGVSQFAFDGSLPNTSAASAQTKPAKRARQPPKPRVSRSRKKKTSAIKSITQYNTENFGLLQRNRRTRHVVSLLSGKKGKIKDLLERLEQEDSSVSQRPSNRQFSTYDSHEWSHILQHLKSKFPQCQPSQVNAVYNYVYGDTDEPRIWHASQLPPLDSQAMPSQGLPASNDVPAVFTLSQVVGESSQDAVKAVSSPTFISPQKSDMGSTADPQCISNTTDEVGSEIQIDEETARAFRAEMLSTSSVKTQAKISIPPCDAGHLAAESKMITARDFSPQKHVLPPLHDTFLPPQLLPGDSDLSFPAPATRINTRISTLKLAARDEIIDLTQCSFNAVKSLISPLKHDVQVPATRTTTWNDCPSFNELALKDLVVNVRLRIYPNIDIDDIYSSLKKQQVSWDLQESFVPDSEEEGEYNVLEIGNDVAGHKSSPVRVPTQLNTPEKVIFTNDTHVSPSLPPSLPPVSYTHLDVYKRQGCKYLSVIYQVQD